jgi:hypothetical protein
VPHRGPDVLSRGAPHDLIEAIEHRESAELLEPRMGT